MKNREHLSFFGCGPVYGTVVVALTVLGMAVDAQGWLDNGSINGCAGLLRVVGVILILLGVVMWFLANFRSELDKSIVSNTLVTTGVYAWVRNPIYTAIMFACTGVLLMACNAWLLLLPPVFWLLMTLMVSATEEKWLRELYGQQYMDYCARVNRCIPWFTKH